MTALPKLSVVVPSFNQGQFIERTIKSIVDQGYPNLELILMDGGSTDDTMAIVERYRDHFTHFQSGKDGGQTAAIADGFDRATGDYISWLNSDDTYSPGALMALGNALAARPAIDFIYGDTHLIDAADQVVAYKRSARALLGVMKYAFLTVPQMSAFWRRSLYHQVGGLDRSLRFCMDYDLFVRLASASRPVRIRADIGNFRLHGDSKTSTLEDVRQAEDRLVHNRYCSIKPSSPLFRPARTFWTGVLVALFVENGSLWARASRRFGNNMQSECS
jgi:glycosyltransferase involved in cell wall biosynthesis